MFNFHPLIKTIHVLKSSIFVSKRIWLLWPNAKAFFENLVILILSNCIYWWNQYLSGSYRGGLFLHFALSLFEINEVKSQLHLKTVAFNVFIIYSHFCLFSFFCSFLWFHLFWNHLQFPNLLPCSEKKDVNTLKQECRLSPWQNIFRRKTQMHFGGGILSLLWRCCSPTTSIDYSGRPERSFGLDETSN